jgi:hypothetical protein
VWVADTLGERVAERHVSAEHGHDSNLADRTAIRSPAGPHIGEWTPTGPPLFASM